MKAIATLFVQVFLGLVLIGLLIYLYFAGVGNILGVQVAIKASEVDRHAINMGQALLAQESITYFDGSKYYRGIFDEKKLDEQMKATNPYFFQPTELVKNVSLPRSFATIIVQDLDSPKQWKTFSGYFVFGIIPTELSPVEAFVSCVGDKFDFENLLQSFYAKDLLRDLFSVHDFTACFGTEIGKVGSSVRAFPVAIRYSAGEIHAGLLSVNLMEV